jgi:hypothetical protein
MFPAQLRSNESGADHRKHFSLIDARVRFRWNVFTEPFPSNELFRLSGVMLQYFPESVQFFYNELLYL